MDKVVKETKKFITIRCADCGIVYKNRKIEGSQFYECPYCAEEPKIPEAIEYPIQKDCILLGNEGICARFENPCYLSEKPCFAAEYTPSKPKIIEQPIQDDCPYLRNDDSCELFNDPCNLHEKPCGGAEYNPLTLSKPKIIEHPIDNECRHLYGGSICAIDDSPCNLTVKPCGGAEYFFSSFAPSCKTCNYYDDQLCRNDRRTETHCNGKGDKCRFYVGIMPDYEATFRKHINVIETAIKIADESMAQLNNDIGRIQAERNILKNMLDQAIDSFDNPIQKEEK